MHAVSSSCIVVTSCVTPYGDVGRRPSLKRDAQPLSTAPTSRIFDSHFCNRMHDTLWEFGRRPAAVGRPDSGDGDGGHPREARRGDFTLCPIAAFRWTLAVFLCVSLHVVHCCLSPFFLTRRPPLAHMLARMRRLFTRTSAVFYFSPSGSGRVLTQRSSAVIPALLWRFWAACTGRFSFFQLLAKNANGGKEPLNPDCRRCQVPTRHPFLASQTPFGPPDPHCLFTLFHSCP